MSDSTYSLVSDAGDPKTHAAAQLWDAIVDLAVAWVNAVRGSDADAAVRAESEFRFLALHYVAQPIDGASVSTGRKAIVRSLYADYGGLEAELVRATIDAVIVRELAAARCEAPLSPSA